MNEEFSQGITVRAPLGKELAEFLKQFPENVAKEVVKKLFVRSADDLKGHFSRVSKFIVSSALKYLLFDLDSQDTHVTLNLDAGFVSFFMNDYNRTIVSEDETIDMCYLSKTNPAANKYYGVLKDSELIANTRATLSWFDIVTLTGDKFKDLMTKVLDKTEKETESILTVYAELKPIFDDIIKKSGLPENKVLNYGLYSPLPKSNPKTLMTWDKNADEDRYAIPYVTVIIKKEKENAEK